MGSAALYHLARRGRRVLGIEQFDFPHAMGSSVGTNRIIRLAMQEREHGNVLLHENALIEVAEQVVLTATLR